MNNVQKFESYIKQNPDLMNVFTKVPLNESGLVVFEFISTIGGSDKKFVAFVNDTIRHPISCVIATLNNFEKKAEMLSLINELNERERYSAAKYTIDDSGNIHFIKTYTASEETFDAGLLISLISYFVDRAEADYSEIMKILWA